MLKEKDSEKAKTIDTKNKVRLIRAIEISLALGKVPPLFSNSHELAYRFVYVGLRPKDLDKRIHKRLLKRVDGMIRETRNLHKNGLSYKRMHELGLEYRYIAMYLQNKISKIDMVEKLNIEIKRYAKRQMTWFKRNPPERPGSSGRAGKKIKWFDSIELKGVGKYARMAMLGLPRAKSRGD